MANPEPHWRPGTPLRVFAVAGEHSGDRLGGKLLAVLRQRLGANLIVEGVGDEDMLAQGLKPVFPMSDIAVMGLGDVVKRLPLIVRRVYQTVAAARTFNPHVLLIVDSPDFTHQVASRFRKQCPDVPIIDYVSPTVWAWRPGRARKMAVYTDHLLALLPFEPAAHARLGGPPCTYVGHPLAERLAWMRGLNPAALSVRLGLRPERPVLVVLPGSRSGVIQRMLPDFRETVRLLSERALPPEVIVPTIESRRDELVEMTADWPLRPHIVTGEDDKFAAFRLARAALASSGTVTLELAAAGTPAVVAYRIGPIAYRLKWLTSAPSIVLANLVLGKNMYPEYLDPDVNSIVLAARIGELLDDTPARAAQLAGLAEIPVKLAPPAVSPSEAGAGIVLRYAEYGRGYALVANGT
jgi:lipid-A-disaccharide synthase